MLKIAQWSAFGHRQQVCCRVEGARIEVG